MIKKPHILTRRAYRDQEAWILFLKKKITDIEYHRLRDMIYSPDESNLCVAQEIIKQKFKKKKS